VKPVTPNTFETVLGVVVAVLVINFASSSRATGVCENVDTLSKLEACRIEVEKRPASAEWQQRLGDAMVYLGDYDGATVAYREVARIRQSDPKSHLQLAGTLAFVQRYIEAVEPIETALRLDPNNIPAHRTAAIIYHQAHRKEDMVRVTTRAAELGDVVSMYDLVAYFRDGYGVDQNTTTAFSWAERAANAGHLKAMSYMVRVHLDGLLGQPVDESEASSWAERERSARRAN